MNTRLRTTITFAVVTMDGGTIREQSYGSVVPAMTEDGVERLAGIVHNTVIGSLPDFLKAK